LGSSRSLKVTDFGTDRKPVYDFLLVNNTTYVLSRTVSELSRRIGQIIAFDRQVPLFNSLLRGKPLNSEQQNLASKN